MSVFLMLICYKDLFDYNISNYNHLLTPRMTSQTDLWADPEEIMFLKVKNITGIGIAILIKNESQMLVTLKMLKHMITCGMAGEEAEQMESSRGQLHFQGF